MSMSSLVSAFAMSMQGRDYEKEQLKFLSNERKISIALTSLPVLWVKETEQVWAPSHCRLTDYCLDRESGPKGSFTCYTRTHGVLLDL